MQCLLVINFLMLSAYGQIINKNVHQQVIFHSHNLQIKTYLTLFNTQEAANRTEKFIFMVDPNMSDYRIFFKSYNTNLPLSYRKLDDYNIPDVDAFEVDLNQTATSDHIYQIDINTFYFNQIKSVKKLNDDKHVAVFHKNLHYYSPYSTFNFTKKFIYNNVFGDVEYSHQPDEETMLHIKYTSLFVPAFSYELVSISYVTDEVFFEIENLERTIEVSHFGFIIIQDKIRLANKGSKMVGHFSPYQDLRLNSLRAVVPRSARNFVFFDHLGKINTWKIEKNEDLNFFIYKIRTPLYGNWKSEYTIGYELPTEECLFYQKNYEYEISIPILDSVFVGINIRKAKVNIIIPAMSEILFVKTPDYFRFDGVQNDYSRFPITGRTSLLFSGTNILKEDIANITVTYKFNTLYLLKVPSLLITQIYLGFCGAIFLLRLNTDFNKL
ncbi:dolichyl-diphosphooligosaccharide--protein glycosyltransferase subunit 1-like [Agrilus planipennis]|uniref:Dolichyl-diphosphooligosaccharide--protein glycosyltransferase subunit 1 n=1 Tax=Agrilus planipennis TaxID=224129 RepID=A0A1W4XHD6_AGRPL|nr:dolichyl-diphosphooligosaccharide--protein glycosyltransferase subunit 1-like [Agrilus planipennis]